MRLELSIPEFRSQRRHIPLGPIIFLSTISLAYAAVLMWALPWTSLEAAPSAEVDSVGEAGDSVVERKRAQRDPGPSYVVSTAELMDPHVRGHIAPETLQSASAIIGRGLTWVFGAMVLAAAAQLVVTVLLPSRKCDHSVKPSEALEAMAG